MTHLKKCPNGSHPFEFEFKQYSHKGEFIHTLLISGFGCKKQGYYDADIDLVLMDNVSIKPLLEINGGMILLDQNWIPEKQAAERLNRKPETLRALVKKGKIPLEFTHINGRTFQYSERSIEKVLLKNSSVIK